MGEKEWPGLLPALEKNYEKENLYKKGYCPLISNTIPKKCDVYVREKLTICVWFLKKL